jgi:8-oxo-dGTP pyrophosphatase MutT (NUDIX family)
MNESRDAHLVWAEKARKRVIGFHGYDVYMSRRRDHTGRKATFTIVEAPDWCNVIAPVHHAELGDCFVMARQFRHASGTITVEFPGGVVDPGEEPARAAARELLEETGYAASNIRLIGVTFPNPAIMTNRAFTYLAMDATFSGDQELDEHEHLDVELVPVSQIRGLERPDFHTHSIMLAALHWYELYERDGLTYDQRAERW